jgi:outer membrane immunogenic protein
MLRILLAATSVLALSTGFAQAADLGVPRQPIAAAIVAPAFNWTGFYVGANLGIGIANTNYSALTAGALSGSGTGLVAGLQAGYNYQINNLVLGIEGDVGYFGVTRRADLGGGNFIQWRTQWDASLRARAGVAIDRTLLYVTGGLAAADIGVRGAAGLPLAFFPFSASQTRLGWTIGAGIEHAVTQNWTIRGEYLYSNYGTKLLDVNNVRLETHKFRIGVNYLFSTGPSAVVARY